MESGAQQTQVGLGHGEDEGLKPVLAPQPEGGAS